MIVLLNHRITGTGTFDGPYWCEVTNQEAIKCPICARNNPSSILRHNLNKEGKCASCNKSYKDCRASGTSPVDAEGQLVPESNSDPINHPSHYTDGGIETIDFIEAKKLNYNCGNATKYISRAGKKDKAERAVDIAKAIWYLQRELNTLKGK